MDKQNYIWAQTGGAILGIATCLLQANWTQVLADINLWSIAVGFVFQMLKVGVAGLVGGYCGKLGQKMMDSSKWFKKFQTRKPTRKQ